VSFSIKIFEHIDTLPKEKKRKDKICNKISVIYFDVADRVRHFEKLPAIIELLAISKRFIPIAVDVILGCLWSKGALNEAVQGLPL
jgi:hypothetical protein